MPFASFALRLFRPSPYSPKANRRFAEGEGDVPSAQEGTAPPSPIRLLRIRRRAKEAKGTSPSPSANRRKRRRAKEAKGERGEGHSAPPLEKRSRLSRRRNLDRGTATRALVDLFSLRFVIGRGEFRYRPRRGSPCPSPFGTFAPFFLRLLLLSLPSLFALMCRMCQRHQRLFFLFCRFPFFASFASFALRLRRGRRCADLPIRRRRS